jgi:hypothetical protein
VIGQQLDGHHINDALQGILSTWHTHQLAAPLGIGLHRGISLITDHHQAAVTGQQLLQATLHLPVHGVLGGKDYNGEVLINKSQGAVLHFTSIEAFTVDQGHPLNLRAEEMTMKKSILSESVSSQWEGSQAVQILMYVLFNTFNDIEE